MLSRIALSTTRRGKVYAELPLSNSKEAQAIVDKAAAVQKEWKQTDLATRLALTERFMKEFEAIREEVAKDITCQMGKPLKQAHSEVSGMFERTKSMMAMAPTVLAEEELPEKKGLWRKITKEPVGVVLVIAPWNYPLLTAVNSIIPAILAGNSVVLKHSWRTPLVAEAFKKAFDKAGAPAGLLSVLHSTHEVVAEVIENPSIGFVAFTGSVGGGRQVYSTVSSKRFIDVTLELGGKDPAYVAPDANIDTAADGLVDGAFYNAGQSCCGIERVYVHRSKYDEFVQKALTFVQAYNLGDPLESTTTLGPIALPQSVDFLKHQVDDARAKGAKVLCGGTPTHDAAGLGRFFAPTLLADCNHNMSIMVEESFGPVLGVTPVDSDEEALKLMNDSPYGLTAAIFTTDIERAKAMAPKLETGTVFMNRCDYLDPELPWSGVKNTGKGVSLSSHGFRGVTRLKGYNFRLPQ